MNLTLYALTTSIISHSPMILLPSTNYQLSFYQFNQIKVNHFYKCFILSYSYTIHATLSKSIFSNFLDPPIKIDKGSQMNCISSKIYNLNQIYSESSLCIDSCIFSGCQNMERYSKGGAIYFVNKNSTLKIHGTIFENCTCLGDGGAIFAASEAGDTNSGGSGSTSHKNMNSFYSHYCCYSGCSAEIVEPNNIQYSGYGSALFVASTKIELNYSSSIECPKFSTSKSSFGAQFDMQTEDVKSCFINATTGNSVCCAAIEYRNAKSGFFCYQTIVNQIGGFVTSFTSLIGPVNVAYCNLVNNTIRFTNVAPSCAIIHVRMKSVFISHFVVIDTKFDGFDSEHHPYFASKGGDMADNFFITVVNCTIDKNLNDMKYFVDITTSFIDFAFDGEIVTTHKIGQLNLGECQGVVQPPPLDATEKFSFSDFFSKSVTFSDSTQFSKSETFSVSDKFSKSEIFSVSESFSKSTEFSISTQFSKSLTFSESFKFTSSLRFLSTDAFSVSKPFSNSEKFSHTSHFSDSQKFSEGVFFTKTNFFNETEAFTQTDQFTQTNIFSKSSYFSKTTEFSKTIDFSKSSYFSQSSFLKTNSASNIFSSTSKFSTQFFSSSAEFTNSQIYAVIAIKEINQTDNDPNVALIAGVTGAVVTVLAASVFTVFFIKKKKMGQISIEFDDSEDSNVSTSEVIIQNPLYRQNMEDDPFQNDFAEHIASLDSSL